MQGERRRREKGEEEKELKWRKKTVRGRTRKKKESIIGYKIKNSKVR